jgi:hypothetical protein
MTTSKHLRVLVQIDGETMVDVDEQVIEARANISTPVERIWFGGVPASRHSGDHSVTLDYRVEPRPWSFRKAKR